MEGEVIATVVPRNPSKENSPLSVMHFLACCVQASRSVCSAIDDGQLRTDSGNILTGCTRATLWGKRYSEQHADMAEEKDRAPKVSTINLRQRRQARRCGDASDLITSVMERKEDCDDVWYRVKITNASGNLEKHWVLAKDYPNQPLFSIYDRNKELGLWVQDKEDLKGEDDCNTQKNKKEKTNAKTAGVLTFNWDCGEIIRIVECYRAEAKVQASRCVFYEQTRCPSCPYSNPSLTSLPHQM